MQESEYKLYGLTKEEWDELSDEERNSYRQSYQENKGEEVESIEAEKIDGIEETDIY